MTKPTLTYLAQSLPASVPFVGPETQERQMGHPFKARLGANESAFGPSPKAIAAMQRAAGEAWMYGDPESHDLRHALAAHHAVAPDNIMVGEGIDTLLGLLVRLYVDKGDAVVTSAGAYPTFNYHVAGFGGDLHTVPYKGDHEDPDALIAKADEVSAKLIYIANPDNPMGTWHSASVINDMISRLPDGCILILDEAYIEFDAENTWASELAHYPNLVVLRTLSKAFALAGLRCGFTLANPSIIDVLSKVIAPYPVPVPVSDIATQALSAAGLARMRYQVLDLSANRAYLVFLDVMNCLDDFGVGEHA